MHKKSDGLKDGCRSGYGPLKLWIQATGASDKFVASVEDPRIHRTLTTEEANGTLREAQRFTIKFAEKYLIDKGEHADYEPDWKCS